MGKSNREGWLTELALKVQPIFKGYRVAPYRITCGWPSSKALGVRSRTIGQCHSGKTSKAGLHELFISPLLEEPLEVAGVVCHELAHVVAGVEAQHKGKFVRVCKHAGITAGKPTQAMPGEKLTERLDLILDKLGEYPHKAIVPQFREVKRERSSFTLECAECGCKVSMTMKWIDEAGPPTCYCGGEFNLDE